MPLYDFKCETCERVEEMLLSSAGSSDIKLMCPDCETETMKRLIGLSSFKLEGGGWYKDGYSSKSAETEKTEQSAKEKSSSTAKETPAKDKPPDSAKSDKSEKKESTSTKTNKTLSKERAA